MIDEADVNEAIAGPQQKKVRPMSPKDRRKRPDSPIMLRMLTSPPNTPPTSPHPPNKQTTQNKTAQKALGKINNNIIQSGESNRKRKLPDDINDRTADIRNKSQKLHKHIYPQLKQLQKQAQLNRLQNTAATVPGKNNATLNSVVKTDSAAANISSILRKAITSQDKPESKKEAYQNDVEGGKNQQFNSVSSESTESELVDLDGLNHPATKKGISRPKSLSPSVSLKRSWQEDNVRLRSVLFKEIRKAGMSK